ncbi:hypothetical protein EHS13_29905 [Paenibacillus psychroresistens]|uniref:Uncharacterized protein n=1 Tax=Paenibacillus psychroresistens TaxID=1778678 RepID=A0A6B8RQX4_9BACL|nr:hypothetical protein [Paenibacillus psychroresistens]QGQ98791.1 hypothetical protein EHS13_29905 [Paenibacillus psychroresistens]
MEGELGSGARIAIALIVIGVIISVIFVILGFTRGTTNQGITTVQNSMDSMSLAQFDDFDQKIQSGTQVTSAIKLFEGRPVATVVRTKAQMLTTSGTGKGTTGHNYGAQLVGTDQGTVTPAVAATFITAEMAKGAGNSWFTVDLLGSGQITYNMIYIPTTKSGTATFIRPTAKFLAELIKDTTGTIVGICFTQQ